ncbi:hypothetical protein K2173_009834 [Erythroxylum novogranatense]|uniref:Uncharacterized protein n=1 Tax=Erythroxylum novogranatense TaxID=1862640 RepID=A0AAV8SZJ1_9ROSI|nr:hypothetical protein K2173_009834 [Erythroxylum novogranatense]
MKNLPWTYCMVISTPRSPPWQTFMPTINKSFVKLNKYLHVYGNYGVDQRNKDIDKLKSTVDGLETDVKLLEKRVKVSEKKFDTLRGCISAWNDFDIQDVKEGPTKGTTPPQNMESEQDFNGITRP